MASLILITMANGRGHCAWWQSCTVPNQTHRGNNNKKRKMYAIKQIKICAEYRDMLPRPRLVLSGTPGLRPIGLSPGSWQTSLGLGSMSRYSAQILICITQAALRQTILLQITAPGICYTARVEEKYKCCTWPGGILWNEVSWSLILLTLLLKLEYSRKCRSIPWVPIPCLLSSPGHQQPRYCLCRINRVFSPTRKDFNNMWHISVENLQKM